MVAVQQIQNIQNDNKVKVITAKKIDYTKRIISPYLDYKI